MSLWMDWGLVFRTVGQSVDVALIFASTSSYWLTVASFRIRFWRSCCMFFQYICHDMKQSGDIFKMWEDSIKVCMTPKQTDADACICCQLKIRSTMRVSNTGISSDQKESRFKHWLSHRFTSDPVSSRYSRKHMHNLLHEKYHQSPDKIQEMKILYLLLLKTTEKTIYGHSMMKKGPASLWSKSRPVSLQWELKLAVNLRKRRRHWNLVGLSMWQFKLTGVTNLSRSRIWLLSR